MDREVREHGKQTQKGFPSSDDDALVIVITTQLHEYSKNP